MKRVRFAGLLAVLLVFSGFADNKITGFSLRDHPSQTEIIVTMQHPLTYHTFTLQTPPRFVIDFDDPALSWQVPKLPDNPVIKSIRYANDLQQQHTRLVLDLKKAASVTLTPRKVAGLPLQLRLKIPHAMQRENHVASRGHDVVIVIDAGHGGKDPGALGRYGRYEKDIVLDIAKKLQREINMQAGFRAYLTRKRDTYLSLRQRLTLARSYHADMFVAIHADAYLNKTANGASVYALSLKGATSEAARWLANRENASELMGGVALDDKSQLLKSVLIDLSQTATLRASLQIGQRVINAMGHVAALHHPKVEQAAFVVLKSPDIPSLLVETGFISNPREEIRLVSTSYQNRLASAMMRGICDYFTQHPPRGSKLAQQ